MTASKGREPSSIGGQADATRLVISGASAGGYTSLAALAFRDTFRAGVSYFGITDPETWDRDTHKFESRYTEGLIEPNRYRERSPVHSVDRIERPVLILQGLDDLVVPPGQADQMAAALSDKGVPVAYLTFDGEGHDFRRSPSIRRTLEAELSFYGQVLGFHPADRLKPVSLNNLSSTRP
jgi:dipeptidyl aminopeptidase/acylaminoacyl peptidase